jgi:CRISPR/Cas system-associated exonuclease Cas4 (RecB family)
MITELNTKIIEYFLMKLLTGLDIDYPIYCPEKLYGSSVAVNWINYLSGCSP